MCSIRDEELDHWWYMDCGLTELEKATGFSRWDYEPDEGYQEFVDVCDAWWLTLTLEQRKNVYRKVNEWYG